MIRGSQAVFRETFRWTRVLIFRRAKPAEHSTPYFDQGTNKMSEKLISRDRISGCWVPNDIEPGEYSGDELRKRVADQQRQLNRAVLADWEFAGETSTSKTLRPGATAAQRLDCRNQQARRVKP